MGFFFSFTPYTYYLPYFYVLCCSYLCHFSIRINLPFLFFLKLYNIACLKFRDNLSQWESWFDINFTWISLVILYINNIWHIYIYLYIIVLHMVTQDTHCIYLCICFTFLLVLQCLNFACYYSLCCLFF